MAENPPSLAHLWFEKASHDEGIAKSLIDQNSIYTDGICFHCQQAVEKYLKGLLIHFSIEFRKSHDLTYLADLLADKIPIPDEIYEKLESLQGFAVEIRYPEEISLPSQEDTATAYENVLFIENFILKNLNS